MKTKRERAADAKDREPARSVQSLVVSPADRSAERLTNLGWTCWPLSGAPADFVALRWGERPMLVRATLAVNAAAAWEALRSSRALRSWFAGGGRVLYHVWREDADAVGVWHLEERLLGPTALLTGDSGPASRGG